MIQVGKGYFMDTPYEQIMEKVRGDGITLTNNEIKDIMKVTISLENRGLLLKGTTTKITCQKGGFFNFLRPLMTAGLPLKRKCTHSIS